MNGSHSALATSEEISSVQAAPSRAPANSFIAFLRHYGPIAASDNMYDELIQAEISRYNVDPPIHIEPARLNELVANCQAANPVNIILTGTAGDGKTHHCRRVWEQLGGDPQQWERGDKVAELSLLGSGKTLVIVKDLSELSSSDKAALFPDLAAAVARSKSAQCPSGDFVNR